MEKSRNNSWRYASSITSKIQYITFYELSFWFSQKRKNKNLVATCNKSVGKAIICFQKTSLIIAIYTRLIMIICGLINKNLCSKLWNKIHWKNPWFIICSEMISIIHRLQKCSAMSNHQENIHWFLILDRFFLLIHIISQ